MIETEPKPSTQTIGFIGLGRMGYAMANNLLSANIRLLVYDKNYNIVKKMADKGAQIALNPAEVAKQVSLVFLCLPFTPEVDDVLFGPNGITTTSRNGLSIIDMSTIYSTNAQDFETRLYDLKVLYSDCPVSGMPTRADDATLTIMFGGHSSEYVKALPYLELMGKFIFHCGSCGTGQMMKSFNNIIYNINIAGICEVLPMAVKAGLDPNILERVFTTASSRSFASEYFLPRILERRFDTDMPMKDAYKDIVSVQNIANQLNASIPVINAMTSTYQNTIAMGHGEEPKSAMLKLYEKILGIIVKRPTHNL